jgi:hypothetical protein
MVAAGFSATAVSLQGWFDRFIIKTKIHKKYFIKENYAKIT